MIGRERIPPFWPKIHQPIFGPIGRGKRQIFNYTLALPLQLHIAEKNNRSIFHFLLTFCCHSSSLAAAILRPLLHCSSSKSQVLESSRERVYSEEEIYSELELMGMESNDLENAYLFLVEHPEKTRAVFGCPFQKRMNILRKMMGRI